MINTSEWIAIAAIITPLGCGSINWYSRLKTLEATVERHGKRLEAVDSMIERLARIETKLDLLMKP